MASRFWTFITNLLPGSLARAEQVSAKFQEIDAALGGIANEMNRSIRFTAGSVPAETKFQVAQTDAQRANLVLGFDGSGLVQLRAIGFAWRGDWAQDTGYAVNDAVIAPDSHSNSIYMSLAVHQSTSSFAADIAAGRWQLMIDLTQTQAAVRNFQIIAGSYEAQAGDDIFVDTSTAAAVIALPATPSISDQPIKIVHAIGNASSNPVTINRNGKLINGSAVDLVISSTGGHYELAFVNETVGWRVISSG